jgi:peptidoglycan/xylan/chitin deacetylase (PgdA/CDA1 family)
VEDLTLNRLRILILTLGLLLPSLIPAIKPLLHPRALRHAARVKLQELTYRLRSRYTSPALVLLYHRVLPETVDDGFRLVVTCNHFRAQLEWLREHADVVSLDELVTTRSRPPGRRPQVAITFDDGYRDNRVFAAELLREYGLPATFYLSTGYLGTEQRFWWDEVAARVVAGTPDRPRDGTAERLLVHRVCSRLRPLPAVRRGREMQRVGAPPPPARSIDLPMSWEEAAELYRMGFSLGAHTVTHPALSGLPSREAEDEIRHSRAMLEARLSNPVRHFCYPYDEAVRWGRRLPLEQAQMVREAGFVTGVTVVEGTVTRGTDLLAIPRLAISDWTAAELGAALSPHLPRQSKATGRPAPWLKVTTRPAGGRIG